MTEDSEKHSDSPVSMLKKWADNLRLPYPETKEQLIAMVRLARHKGVVGDTVFQIIKRVLDVETKTVGDAMINRALAVTVSAETKLEDVLQTVTDSGHSRFPVMKEDEDEVVGILLAKDILSHFPKNGNDLKVKDIMRPPVYIVESKRLGELLNDFRSNRTHMGVVVDEYGGMAGLITIEDALEEIVGEIEDESDPAQSENIIQESENQFIVNALTEIADINEHFNIHLEDDVDTIGGFIIKEANEVPAVGEVVTYDQLAFEITKADKRRVKELRVTRLGQTSPEETL